MYIYIYAGEACSHIYIRAHICVQTAPAVVRARVDHCVALSCHVRTFATCTQVRAVELVSENEGELRGVYGGAVGYFGYSGNMDTAIAIR